MTLRSLLAGLLFAAGLAACERQPLKAPPGSFVKLVSVSPDTKSPLKMGDKVKVQVEVSYALTVDAGQITLVVQAADKSLANRTAAVKKGEGRLTLTADFVVPETSAVQVYVPLSAQGQKATATVAHRSYKVVK